MMDPFCRNLVDSVTVTRLLFLSCYRGEARGGIGVECGVPAVSDDGIAKGGVFYRPE